MSDGPQQSNWLDKPASRFLAGTGVVIALFGFVGFAWHYNDLANRQLPAVKERAERLQNELRDARRERDELQQSVNDTDALLKAIASIPGEIRQVSRDVFISYDEDSSSLITQIVDGQQFQWRIIVKKEEDGSYSGMVGHRLFGSSLPASRDNEDEETKKLFSAMRSGIDQMGLFINAADRIDLNSRDPQQIASAKSLSSIHPPPENGLEIYLVIERNEDRNRRWRCALIATMRK
jgi:hypothetical protein